MLLSTIGINVSRHYCGNILKDTAIFFHAENCGDMERLMDCCHNEIDHFKIQDDFQITNMSFDLTQEFTLINFFQTSFIDNISDSKNIKYSFIEAPLPPFIRQNTYIQIQSFLL